MTLYVIENDNCEVLDRTYLEFTSDVDRALIFDEPTAPVDYAEDYGGRVVELVEKPKPVEVSKLEADMLADAKNSACPLEHIWRWLSAECSVENEDRLMRAYVNGWAVKKPKRWNVKVPHAANSYYYDMGWGNGIETQDYKLGEKPLAGFKEAQFSADDITRCGLQNCEKVEI